MNTTIVRSGSLGVLAIAVLAVVALQAGSHFRAQTSENGPRAATGESCQKNDDCEGDTVVCSAGKVCTALINPVCSCSQPQVMQCAETSGRARFTFCERGCRMTDDGARCM